MHVSIVVFDGADELDVVGPYRVFTGAGYAGVPVSVSLNTIEPAEWVTASNGLRIGADGPLEAVEPDLVVVPGGGWNAGDEVGARAEASSGDIPRAISELHSTGVTVAGVCTGTMLLERAGLIDDRPAVTHAGALDDLRDTEADVVDARVVDDGDVLTAGGITSGIDLALHLVEREFGGAIATSVATNLEYEPRGSVYESKTMTDEP